MKGKIDEKIKFIQYNTKEQLKVKITYNKENNVDPSQQLT